LIARGTHVVWEKPDPSKEIAAELRAAALHDVPCTAWIKGDWPQLPDRVLPHVSGGLTYEGTGHVTSPKAVTMGMAEAFVALGGKMLRVEARKIALRDGGWEIACEGSVHYADELLLATGVEAPDLLRPLDYKVPMIAERGYHLAMPNGGTKLDRPTIFRERGFIVTPMENELRATSTTEFSKRDAPFNPRRIALLRGHAQSCGLIGNEQELRQWMGCRPSLPDFLPAIGKSARHQGLYFAFGHQHLGLTLSGATARMVREMIVEGSAPPPELALERFH
jgi:D-amino-acid dehydrogenase